MMKNRQIAVLCLLTMLLLSAAPIFVFAAEENAADQSEDKMDTKPNEYAIVIRTQRMLEIANRTAMRIEYFIGKIRANETIIEALNNTSLLDDFEGNVTLFEDAKKLLDEALTAIESEDYEAAIANITEAMKTFREVYRAIHIITEKHMVPMRNRVMARGLIIAMQRDLKRIEWIRRLVHEEDENITRLLNEAEQYLNITVAEEMLAEGNVTGVSHNLIKANQLISKVYPLLRERARLMIGNRMRVYLNGMERACQKILVKIAVAKKLGVNVSAVLDELGYQNETEFKNALLNLITTAHGKVGDIKKALLELQKISKTFWRMDRALTRHLHQRQWKHHESWDGQSENQNQSQNQNQTQHKPEDHWAGLGKGGGNGNRRGRP